MPRVPSALHRLDLRLSALRREVAAAAATVLVLGLGVATAGAPVPAPASPLQATSAGAVTEVELATPAPSPSASPRAAAPTPSVAPVRTPSPAPRAVRVPERWLPSGTGMWLHDWSRSEKGHADVVVDRALDAGLTHLYVQTGSSRKGWIGTPVLSQLLPATAGTGLKVIAWDFPKLVHPVADAKRLARAAAFRRPGAPRVAAVAPDVETGSEGTRITAAGIDTYYRTLRAALPADVAIIATVPWPSEHRVNSYPYHRTMPHADAVSPMAYWYNRPAGTVTATSMRWLARFGKPVIPVGQGYDGRIDVPRLKPDPAPDRSVQAFVDAARAGGAPAVSLWSWQTTGPLQWGVLARAAGFPSLPGRTVATLAPLVPPSLPPVVTPSPVPVVAPSLAPAPEPVATPTPEPTPTA